ncbi:MAG: DUF4147 domain-containing protein [Thermoanaerobaculia bacterium]|nr:DUF4147 domain-containing protein [Thermoanaerobaculia bacterium]
MPDLETIYRQTLSRCAPQELVRTVVRPDMPRDVVAIGKCAGALLDGVAAVHPVRDAIAVIPRMYPPPIAGADVFFGGHPQVDEDSFSAGNELLRFVDAHDEILFLISGGGSACVESPLVPWFTRRDIADTNARLIDAGLPIAEINCVRKHLSAIKGGRLAARVRRRCVTLVYSDVGTGDLASVASGPTLPDSARKSDAITILESIGGCDRIVTALRDESVPDTVAELTHAMSLLVADNNTLTRAAARIVRQEGLMPVMWEGQIEGDVSEAARALASRAATLRSGEVLIAGGEPTVVRHGDGRGGRCSEMAVRFAIQSASRGLRALFGSSDGVDGSSGAAGVAFDPVPAAVEESAAVSSLSRSDSMTTALRLGRAVIMLPTGNNLRDLYLVARP